MNPVSPAGPPEVAWPAIAAVVLLTVAAALVHWWLKGRGLIPSVTNPIKVVATRSLGGKRAVAIVEVEQQRFLLGMTDDAIALLSSLPSEAQANGSSSVVSGPVAVRSR
jgi:flagellar biogenesis protein FliO